METTTSGSPAANNPRFQRGLALAKQKQRAFKHIAGDTYLVPSQTTASSGVGYVVNVSSGQCSCPDYETTGGVCKHMWALRVFRHEIEVPDGVVVVTDVRVTYGQKWPAYNRAQCEEKSRVQLLLRGLCDGIAQPPQQLGRPRLALGDAIYGATMKVYGTMSGRRSTTDIRACENAGLMEHAPAYNTVFKYMADPSLTPILSTLIDESAKPLIAIEHDFAADATGFAAPTYARWFDYRHNEDRRVQNWVKLHAMVGTTTNVITTAVATEGSVNDSPQFERLVKHTKASGFDLREVSADKAYLSNANIAAVEAVGAMPYIPFKSNSTPHSGSAAWRRLYHYYSLNREDFLKHYHKRSNVESTFSAVKRKFSANVRSKKPVAQMNEALVKCLCFNLSVLVHSIHEFGIEPKFWMPPEAAETVQ